MIVITLNMVTQDHSVTQNVRPKE